MTRLQRVYFLHELRAARAETLKDAESFPSVIHCIERLGQFLSGGRGHGLGAYFSDLDQFAQESALAISVPQQCPAYHASFAQLYGRMRRSRNEAAHVGLYARHLSATAAQVSMILEDAISRGLMTAADLMIRDVATASPWEPVSFIRQKMIANSFSFLPVWIESHGREAWHFVSDNGLGRYLMEEGEDGRGKRLATPLEAAAKEGLRVEIAATCAPDTPIEKLITATATGPVLVLDDRDPRHLRGLVTSFDLL